MSALRSSEGDGSAAGAVPFFVPAPTPAEVARGDERRRAEHVPPEVAEVLALYYAPDEVAALFRALGEVHRVRLARLAFREARRAQRTVEEAVEAAANDPGVMRSEGWVRQKVYPRRGHVRS